MEKRGIEFSFTWLFAIIIGIVILVLAIYAATKIISTGKTETGTAAAKEIGVLLNPLETGFEEGKTSSLSIATDTRIYNGCDNFSNFGNQNIQTAQKTFGKFSEPSVEVSFPNKYIFSSEFEEGKQFYIFSKPFEFPFKVSDLIYLSSANKKYCFIDAPENIEEELDKIGQDNLLTGNCSASSGMIRVCFGTGSCDMRVRYGFGYVEKNNQTGKIYFETDALMYAAIFSDKDIYECQAKRLMSRAEELANIYEKKANLLSQKDCNSNLDISTFRILLDEYNESSDLSPIFVKSEEIKQQNEVSSCSLW